MFPAGEIIAYVEITIIDNYEPNHDTTFNITLSNHREHFDNLENPTPTLGTLGRVEFVLGAVSLSQVIIIDDDHPGMLSFQHLLVPGAVLPFDAIPPVLPIVLGLSIHQHLAVLETSGHVCVKVVRTGGAAGTVSVDYYTSDGSATAGKHYVSAKGTLVFGPKVTEQDIEVQIINNDEINPDTVFHVMLCNPTNLATIGRQVWSRHCTWPLFCRLVTSSMGDGLGTARPGWPEARTQTKL